MKRLILLIFCLSSIVSWGQSIKGRVLDAKTKESIPQASITVPGVKGVGTAADLDGNFTFTLPQGKNQITVSFVGYKSKTVTVSNQQNLLVELDPDSDVLEDMVVVGYGTQKKENLTGAVSSVDIAKTLDSRPVSDVGRALQGSTAGLNVMVNNGEAGADPTIRIRGQLGSINGSSAPLILLDNVEIPSLMLVNPDDIESISILKDAASASIYGAKAAFGVVLINSKKGAKTDKVTVSYQTNLSWDNPTKNVQMATLDGLEYGVEAMNRQGAARYSVLGIWSVDPTSYQRAKEWQNKYGGQDLGDNMLYGRDYYEAGGFFYSTRLWDTKSYMIKDWAFTQQHNLSVNGTSGKTNYSMALAYYDKNGVLKQAKPGNDHYERYNISVGITTQPTKWLTLRSKFMYTNSTAYSPMEADSSNSAWLYLYRWGPTMPLGKQDDQWVRGPIGQTASANRRDQGRDYLSAMIGGTATIASGLTLDADYTFSYQTTEDLKRGTVYDLWDAWSSPRLKTDAQGNQLYVNGAGERVSAGSPGATPEYALIKTDYSRGSGTYDFINNTIGNTSTHTFNAFATYSTSFKDHSFKAMAGMNMVLSDWRNLYGQVMGLLDPSNPQFNLATGVQTTSGRYTWESQLGFFGRVNYSFRDKYLFEANLRYDGSSKFPTHLRWKLFPSFSAGYVISEENFWENIKPVVSSMKFRASWGSIGNQAVPNTLYIPTMARSETGWIQGGKKTITYGTPAAVRDDITWESVETLNLAADMRFFKNKLGVTAEWYQRRTKGMIIVGAPVPSTYGTGSPVGNYGELTTRGWEIAADFNHQFSNGIRFSVNATLSDGVSKITDYQDTPTHSITSTWYKGKTYGEIWGYTTDRLYQKEDFVYNTDGSLATQVLANGKRVNVLKDPKGAYQDYLQSGSFYFGPGDVKYKDTNGDGVINNGDATVENSGDMSVIGNTTPRYEYSLRLGADWKGFDVSVYLQGVGSRQVRGDGSLVVPGYNVADGAMSQAIAGDFWREDRTDAFFPRPWNLSTVAGGNTDLYNTKTQTRYLLDMSYLRVKNITIGYSLPTDLISKVRLSKVRFYVSGENLFTFDNLGDLPIDPETQAGKSSYTTGNYNAGRLGVATPVMKTVSVGLQLNI